MPTLESVRRIAALVTLLVGLAACTGVDDAGPTAERTGDSEVHHIVLDTDLAFDDIMALLYLLQRDDVAIDAVTISGTGEAHCDPGVRNALGLLALGGSSETPVACGRETPLQGSNAFPDEWRAAVDDLSMLGLPTVDTAADPRGAEQLLLDTLDGDATLLTLGPLTNVAMALRADPGLVERVPRFVAMAGAIDAAGNTPAGVAEYNVWVDPLAAEETIAGMDVTLVPLDATEDVPFTPFFADALAAHLSNPEAEAVHAMIEANEEIFTAPGTQFWDTLATALVFHPELATWGSARVLVTASQDAGAGWIDRYAQGSAVRFATSVPDPLAFEREYLSVLTGKEVTDVRPDPTVTIAFDGERCSIEPGRLGEGEQVVAYSDPTGTTTVGVLIRLTERFRYADLRAFTGPDGSTVAPDTEPPKGLRIVAFVNGLTEARTVPSTMAAVCLRQDDEASPAQVWVSTPIRVRG